MKYKYIIAMFLVGWAITIVGSLFKLMHWPAASIMLITGFSLQVTSILVMIFKVLGNKDFTSFLNK